jgi:hypothetical protein
MKKMFLKFLFVIFSFQLIAQAPNSPDKICFNYDRAGNRIAQSPAWLNALPPIDCQCNDPDNAGGLGRWWYIDIDNVDLISTYVDDIKRVLGSSNEISIGVINKNDFNVTESTFTMPSLLQNSLRNQDNFIFILSPTPKDTKITKGNIIVQDDLAIEVSITPNPNEGEFKVIHKGFDEENTFIYIYDTNGKILYKRPYLDGVVNVSEFVKGVYNLILKDKNNMLSTRFIKH